MSTVEHTGDLHTDVSPALEIEKLTKRYGKSEHYALHDVSLNVPRGGTVYGLLGPNGAGKSTLIGILAGTVVPSSGRASVCGFDVQKNPRMAKASIGVMPQETTFDPFFTPLAILKFQCGIYGIAHDKNYLMELLSAFNLEDQANSAMRELSGGMKRRVQAAIALVHRPQVVILDEPTVGVDILQRHALWEIVRTLRDNGTSVIFTTHYLEEASALCDHLAVIGDGRILINAPIDEVSGAFGAGWLSIRSSHPQELLLALTQKGWNAELDKDSAQSENKNENNNSPINGIKIPLHALSTEQTPLIIGKNLTLPDAAGSLSTQEYPRATIGEMLATLSTQQVALVNNIDVKKPTLEDVFLSLLK